MKIELGDLNSVKKFAEEFKSKYKKVDILINNAGIVGSKVEWTKQGYETNFGINYLGHFLLVNLLMDQLRASKQARIIGLSSIMHEFIFGKLDFEELLKAERF